MKIQWHAWSRLDKPSGWSHLNRIAAASNEDGRVEIFGATTEGALWQIWQTAPNNGWSHWASQGKPTAEGIELMSASVGQALAVRPNEDGRLEVIVISDRDVWRIAQTRPNNGWGEWQLLGEPLSGGVVSLDLAANHDGRLQLFAIGFDGEIASREQTTPNGDWGEWHREFPRDPRIPVRAFVSGRNEDGRLEIIATLSSIPALATQSEPGGKWRTGFGNVGISASSPINGPMSMARNTDGTLEASMIIDGRLVNVRQHVPNQPPSPGGGGWKRADLERPAEHIVVGLPVLKANGDGRLEVFVAGSDGQLWHRPQHSPSEDWSDWHSLGNPSGSHEGFSSLDVARNQDGRLEVFAVHKGELWHTWQTS